MTKPGSRQDHVQEELPRGKSPLSGNPLGLPAEGPTSPQPDGQDQPLPAPMAARYWLVIMIWAIGFAIMVLFELAAAIWRR